MKPSTGFKLFISRFPFRYNPFSAPALHGHIEVYIKGKSNSVS